VQEIGLLEQCVLLVAGPDAAGRRELLASTGEPTGFARRQRDSGWLGWLGWLRQIVAVHEQHDEPLVFTICRNLTFKPAYRVLDANEELVGTIALPWIHDRWGFPDVELSPAPEGGGVFRSSKGEILAQWAIDGGSIRLILHEPARPDPFLKMLLLAATLLAPVGGRE
jgi:hypothetical protein